MAKPRVLLWTVTAAVILGSYVAYRRWKAQKEDEEPFLRLQPKSSAAAECAVTTSGSDENQQVENRASNGWREAQSSIDCGCGEGGSCHTRSDPVDHCATEEVEDAGTNECMSNVTEGISLVNRIAPILSDEAINFIIPEDTRVFVKTFGCSHNVSDSEFMAGLLKQAGYQLTDSMEDCDIAVLNSCTVKNPSQDGAVNMAMKCQALGKKVVMGGCVSQADNSIPQLESISSIGVKNIDRVVEAVTETLKGNVYKAMSTRRSLPELDLPKVRKNPLVESRIASH